MTNRSIMKLAGLVATSLALAAPGPGQAQQPEKTDPKPPLTAAQQKKIDGLHKMRDETLERLYKEKPETREEVAKAVGYGVFDASQVNVILFVGASGRGLLVDNQSGKEIFMTMKRAGTGPGVGYKSYYQILVFKNRTVFEQFGKVGADVGAGADATMKTKGSGTSFDGSVSFNPELSVYQFTDSGLLLQANWGGVAYLPDSDLNR